MAGEEQLERQITARGIWLLAVNGMIGAGIFAVPGGAAALMGAWSPLVYVVCAILLGLIVACYAELASRFNSTGGPVLYMRMAFGKFAGFETGLAVYATRITAFAANVNLMVASIAFFVPALSDGPLRILTILAIIAVLAGINMAGARPAMRAMGLLTILKFLPLLAIAMVGLFHINPSLFPDNSLGFPESAQWSAAILLVIYAFVGWESAVIPAGETREPGRAMPLGLFGALAVVALLYVVIQIVCVAVVPDLANSQRALVDAGSILFGPAGALFITLGVIVSVGGNATGTVVTTPRLTYALALEKDAAALVRQGRPAHPCPGQLHRLLRRAGGHSGDCRGFLCAGGDERVRARDHLCRLHPGHAAREGDPGGDRPPHAPAAGLDDSRAGGAGLAGAVKPGAPALHGHHGRIPVGGRGAVSGDANDQPARGLKAETVVNALALWVA